MTQVWERMSPPFLLDVLSCRNRKPFALSHAWKDSSASRVDAVALPHLMGMSFKTSLPPPSWIPETADSDKQRLYRTSVMRQLTWEPWWTGSVYCMDTLDKGVIHIHVCWTGKIMWDFIIAIQNAIYFETYGLSSYIIFWAVLEIEPQALYTELYLQAF